MSTLDELIEKLSAMPEDARKQIEQEAFKATAGMRFIPSPGPQTEAYFSLADVLLFGGSPGGGKSALEIGLATNEHYRSLIIRKKFTDLEGIIDNAKKIIGSDDGFIGGTRPKYKKSDGGVIHFAGLSSDGGIGGHQGVDHDLVCVDEAATIPENQIRLLMGWLRTDRAGQRCRMVLASNPPLDSTGDWMIVYFAPWLDETHPNPAMPGELRYFLPCEDGTDRECQPHEYTEIHGVKVYPQSRTFIPSKFTDNPYYNPEDYAKSLAGLPISAREILVSGNFMLARQDDEFQCIPTAWIREAQARWTQRPPENVPMCAIGVDPAGGGMDKTTIALRHDGWFAPVIAIPGIDTPNGKDIAGLIVANRRDGADVVIDMGGGYGGVPYTQLKENNIEATAYKGAESSFARTADKKLGFTNKRSATYWKFREALDPSQEGGSNVALPHDPELVADLTAPRFEVTGRGIKLETKDDIKDRLGRSPDKGDAVVMCWSEGRRISTEATPWKGRSSSTPKVNVGYNNRKK